MSIESIAGLILCGGRSSRFGNNKAWSEFGESSLLETVISRVSPQVGHVMLGVQETTTQMEGLGLPLLADAVQRHRGPLTGLYTGLKNIDPEQHEWLALFPCDAPFLPMNLVEVLFEAADVTGQSIVTACSDDVVQPTFSLWHQSMLPEIEAAVLDEGAGGLMTMLDRLDHAVVDWPDAEPPAFFNINTPQDLAAARELYDQHLLTD